MKHEIDLNNCKFRTDLMIEQITKKIKEKKEIINDIKISEIILKENNELNKKSGTYITIEFDDVTDIDNSSNITKVFIKYINKILKKIDKSKYLIIGLGNKYSTPDSLGPKVIDNIIVTSHISDITSLDNGFSNVSSFSPGVIGNTGINTIDIIKNIVKSLKPSCIIVIDSLVSKDIKRINKAIEINNVGIVPGSGVGSNYNEISYETLNIPVIAIGVPTVVYVNTIIFNLTNKYSKNIDNFMVTPTDIDFEIKKLSKILSNGLNSVLHPKIKNKLNN